MIKIWERVEDEEEDNRPRVWEHQDSDDVVRIEKFENDTWDTFRNDRLVANYDTADEAIQRGERIVAES